MLTRLNVATKTYELPLIQYPNQLRTNLVKQEMFAEKVNSVLRRVCAVAG